MTEDKLYQMVKVHKDMQTAQHLLDSFSGNTIKRNGNLRIEIDTIYGNFGKTDTRAVIIDKEFAEIIFQNIITTAKEYYKRKQSEFENM